ncbi:MAG TPA: hypothetical protein VJX10_10310 [Pseudonocardiaceae bacterium]|nr:hypothetical protein [Pseudonocardiaceae bacterium]
MSATVPNAHDGEVVSGGLEAWIARSDDTAPLDTVDRPAGAAPAGRLAQQPMLSDTLTELDAMETELRVAKGKARLQRDPAWLDVLSDEEVTAERRAVEELRAMRRRQLTAAARSSAERADRERRATDRLADLELSDRLWQRRALARRARLLDSTSRLASLQRTHVVTSAVLIALAVAGISWTSVGVHDALVGPVGSPLAYVVEPLFSLPLVMIMTLQARAAQWGREFPSTTGRSKVYALEAALLLATVLVNTSGVVPGLGRWQGTTVLLAHLAPPLLILVAVTLQPMAAGFIAEVLTNAHIETTQGAKRLSADTVDVLNLTERIRDDWSAGVLRPSPDGGPSIAHVQSLYGIGKQRAQAGVDAWRRLFG